MATIKVTTVEPDGTVTESEMVMPADLQADLERARAEWKRLREAGTPYWCVHEGRDVSHPRAYWQDDQPHNPIHRNHGVRCRECGGYIQEG